MVVAQKFIGRAVILIRPRFRNERNHASRRLSELRFEPAGIHGKLRDCLYRRRQISRLRRVGGSIRVDGKPIEGGAPSRRLPAAER